MHGETPHRLRRALKRALYRTAKAIGLFPLARWWTRRDLRIFGFHGIDVGDEPAFRPGLFHTVETFRERLEIIRRGGFPVVELEEGVRRLRDGTLPPAAVVITIDDGFRGVLRHALPALESYGFPATVYVTTYYVGIRQPVFGLAVRYLLWRTDQEQVDLTGISDAPGAPQGVRRRSAAGLRQAVAAELTAWGDRNLGHEGREAFLRGLAARLGCDYDRVFGGGSLEILDVEELRELVSRGIDLQLHTHRHRLPESEEETTREVVQNRAVLAPIVKRPLVHFCYPMGIWSPRHLPWLRALGIETATTCDRGLARADSDPLALPRMLDLEDVTAIEFEAEVWGFADLVRRALRFFFRGRPKAEGQPT